VLKRTSNRAALLNCCAAGDVFADYYRTQFAPLEEAAVAGGA
jgi:hypothetical protein